MQHAKQQDITRTQTETKKTQGEGFNDGTDGRNESRVERKKNIDNFLLLNESQCKFLNFK